jgi:hypothetical protein
MTDQRHGRPPQLLTINGIARSIGEWQRHPKCRVAIRTIYGRLQRGWTPLEAVFFRPANREAISERYQHEQRPTCPPACHHRLAVVGQRIALGVVKI